MKMEFYKYGSRDWVVYYWKEPCLWYRIIDEEQAKKMAGKIEPSEGICSRDMREEFLDKRKGGPFTKLDLKEEEFVLMI